MTVSFGAALLAGLLSFLSPCVLPLVPGYIGFLGGLGNRSNDVSGQAKTIASRLQLIMASTLFVAGFLTVFVALGASSSMAGSFVARNLVLFQIIGGGLIAVLGLHFLGLFSVGLLNRDVRFMPSPKRFGTVGAYVVGLAFGFGWTPCVGPVLATILMLSAGSGGESDGAGLLFAYGLGLGLPFCASAAAVAFTRGGDSCGRRLVAGGGEHLGLAQEDLRHREKRRVCVGCGLRQFRLLCGLGRLLLPLLLLLPA